MAESFAAFMARALHDPQRGYYARRIQGIGGQRGDFATAATLSPLLGQGIAAWLRESKRAMPEVRHVIEVGAGNGALTETVRKSLGWWGRRGLRWHIVETSVALQEQQKQRLGASVEWHSRLEEALEACAGAAFIYHNELLDAFPVRIVQCHDGEWQEVFVEFENGRASELLRTLEVIPGFSVLAHMPQHSQQRCELHQSVRDWLHGWVPKWKRGAMLTVDYGDLFPALYRRRPRGTLRAYLMHQRLEGMAIYENVGRQDITADVNFTDYRAWAAQLGLIEIGFASQAEFLQARVPGASGPMLDPQGAGGAFKVVTHRRVTH